jgi:anti-sigma-K factor RskA
MSMEPLAHDELRDQAAAYVLGALTADERKAFETHLATCAECTAEVRSLAPVAGALAQTVPQVEPPSALRSRVLSYASRSARPAEARAAVAPMAARPASRERAGMLPAWLAVAASLVVAAGLGVYAVQLRGRVETLEARLQDALARAQTSEGQLASVVNASNQAQSQIAVLTAPDVTRVDLAGQQPIAPAASARAFFSGSRGVLLSASNLPPLQTGRTYQLWFIVNKVPVAGGLFQPDAAGSSNVLLPVDSSAPRPEALAVTSEPAGGSAAPTLPLYLVGTVGAL